MTLAEQLTRLQAVIEARRGADPARSYSAALLADPARAAKKLGEEAVELAIAAAQGDRRAVISESADLLYHLLVLLEERGVGTDDVARVVDERHG